MVTDLSLPQLETSSWTDKGYFQCVSNHAPDNHPDSLYEETCIDLTPKRETGLVAAAGHQKIGR